MIRIMYLVSTLRRSGPTNQLYNLIKYLDRLQFAPVVVTLSPEPVDSRWGDFQALVCDVRTLGLSRLRGLFSAKRKLIRLIEELFPDILHSQGIRADVLYASLSAPLKKIATIRNFPQIDYAMKFGPLKGKAMTWRHTRAMRNLDLCVGVSKAVTGNLTDNYSIENTFAILNGIDDEAFFPLPVQKKQDMRKKLKLPSDGHLWISSGHLSELKNPLFLVSAWKKKFIGSCSSDHLLFIGNGPLCKECAQAVATSSNIHLIGRVSNVVEYLQASDYFISSSKSEGLPNAVLEALSCGLPVVLSNIQPHREIWEMNPLIGTLFECDSIEDVLQAIEDVKDRERAPMSRAAVGLIQEHLSARKMSEKYQALYQRMLNTGECRE